MTSLLVTTYLLFTAVIGLNLFIALLSDTFQRVYDNAQANAEMQQVARNKKTNLVIKKIMTQHLPSSHPSNLSFPLHLLPPISISSIFSQDMERDGGGGRIWREKMEDMEIGVPPPPSSPSIFSLYLHLLPPYPPSSLHLHLLPPGSHYSYNGGESMALVERTVSPSYTHQLQPLLLLL